MHDPERQPLLDALAAVDGGTWQVDLRTGAFVASERALLLNGLRPGDPLDTNAAMSPIHPDDRARVAAALERSIATGSPYRVEFRCVWPDGSVHWLDSRARPIAGPEGPLLTGVVFDVTEQHGALAALSFQSTILSRLGEAVVAIDGDRRITWFGAAAERLYGMAAQDALGRSIDDLYRPRWLSPGDEEACAAALRERGEWRGELVHELPSGKELYVEVSATRLVSADGRDQELLAVIRDAGERRLAQQALRESEARAQRKAALLQAVLDTTPAAVMIAHDAQATNIEGNPYSFELLRQGKRVNLSLTAPPQERPRNFRVTAHGRELGGHELPMQRAALTGEPVRNLEIDLEFDDGIVRHVLGNAAPLHDGDGARVGAVGTFVDVTDERRASAEAARLYRSEHLARAEAERLSGIKERLLAVVGHDLRGPLQLISTCAELIFRDGAVSPAQTRRLAQIQRAVRQMDKIIGNLGDYSAARQGELLPIRPRAVDLHELCEALVNDLRTTAPARRIELVSSGPCSVRADPARLTQALTNLLNNALTHAEPSACVQLGLVEGEHQLELSVWNDGEPIAAPVLATLFEPFSRPPESRGRNAGGLGLGLFIVREIARAHGGRAVATSAPGEGTRFSILLPRQ